MKIYGPYTRKDKRQHVIIVDNGISKCISYPRYLLSKHLNRELLPEETVDHINNDFTDNRIENLQILSLSDNIKKQQKLNSRKTYTFNCPVCGVESTKYLNYVKNNWNKGKKGPFCSRKCAGLATYQNPWGMTDEN